MSWFLRCSWCGGPFNGGNCRRCTNVSFGDEFVRNPDPISYDETPDFSYPPPQPRHTRVSYVGTFLTMVMIVHHGFPQQYLCCENCGGPHANFQCQPRNQNFYEPNLCYNSNSFGFDQPPQYSIDHQPQSIQEDLNQQRMNDVHNEWIKSHNDMIESRNELLKTMQSLVEMLRQREQAANLSTHTPEPSRCFNSICYDDDDDDDDEESTIPLNEIISQIPPSIAITPVLPTMKPEDSLIMRDEDLCTIPEKESDELINSSVEGLVPIPRGTSLVFNGVLEDIESKDSYVSNLDEPALLVTPLSDANKDKCFDPRGDIDEIDAFLNIDVSTDIEDGYHDSERDIIYLKSLLINDTIHNLPPEVFLDHDPRSLKDEPDNDDLKSMVKVFDPGIHEKIISLTYVRLPFEDRHYFSLTFVVRIFLPYLTYSMDSSLLLSSGSEDTIFDPGISVFSFYSLEPAISHRNGTFMIAPDYEDSRARGFVHHSLELLSFACLYMGIRYPRSY
ncbi:hypothetical protein Tco_0699838 [Tanacetum coccineum]